MSGIEKRSLQLLFLLLLGSGCTKTIHLKSTAPNTELRVDGEVLDKDGKAEVGLGVRPIEVELVGPGSDQVSVVDVPRTAPFAWPMCAGLCASGCLLPVSLQLAFALANPTLLVAPLVLLATQDVGVVTRTFDNPSLATLPCMVGCAVVGLVPLSLFVLAGMPADEVDVDALPQRAPLAAPADEAVDGAAPTPPTTDKPAPVEAHRQHAPVRRAVMRF